MTVTRMLCRYRQAVLVGLTVLSAIGQSAGNEVPNVSGATTVPLPLRPPTAYRWQPIFRGIDHASAETSTPVPMRVNGLRVQLREPGIGFLVTPSNGEAPLDTTGTWTSAFLLTYKCQAAVNASPFAPVVQRQGTPEDVLGLSISRGDRYSPPNDTYDALLISKDNKAWIATPPINTKNAYNAVGGFRLLLKDGKNVGKDDIRHPRTAAGISKDGRLLYLVVLDGRQKRYSEGATTAEMAEWMRSFGAWDALNFDGGGSTALVISDGHGGSKVLNRPIDLGFPGKERVVANHLGIFAKPLEKPVLP